MQTKMEEILKQIPFFAQLSEEDLAEIAENVQMQYLPADHIIFNEGDAGTIMYIIKSGKVQVIRGSAIIAELGANEFFGEMALVSNEPRNATIKTLSDVELFTLTNDDFQKLIANNTSIASMVSYEVVKRTSQ